MGSVLHQYLTSQYKDVTRIKLPNMRHAQMNNSTSLLSNWRSKQGFILFAFVSPLAGTTQ